MKNVVTTGAGLLFFTIQPTAELLAGLLIGLIGSILYAAVKLSERTTLPSAPLSPTADIGVSAASPYSFGALPQQQQFSRLLSDNARLDDSNTSGGGVEIVQQQLPALELVSLRSSDPALLMHQPHSTTNHRHAMGINSNSDS
jgi:hypothetical protein